MAIKFGSPGEGLELAKTTAFMINEKMFKNSALLQKLRGQRGAHV